MRPRQAFLAIILTPPCRLQAELRKRQLLFASSVTADERQQGSIYPTGTVNQAMTESYPLKKALPGLAGIGLDNWGVECTAHTGIPSRRGWSGTPSMNRAPDPRSELGGGEVP